MGEPNIHPKSRAISLSLLIASFALATVACEPKPTTLAPLSPSDSAALIGRFLARPGVRTGTVPIGLSVQTIAEGSRPFGLYVPTTYDTTRVWPVTVLLHGFGVSGEEMAIDFQTYAESAGMVVIAPNSYGVFWDLLQFNSFGTDVAHINNVLTWAFAHIAVDPARLSVSGFSDGGTYGLWLGLKNGDLFTRVAAMSPCAGVPNIRTGNPLVFISHGTEDTVAPIDQCSRVTVPILQADGYTVEFVEYSTGTDTTSNGHFVIPAVLTHAMTFLSQPGG